MQFNKIMGALFFALLMAWITSFIAKEAITAEVPEKVAFPVETLKLATAAAPAAGGSAPAGAAAAAPQAEAIDALLVAADVAAGQKVARACTACHSFDKGGANKVGPALWGVVGRVVANVDGFAYSEAMKSRHDRKWTYAELNSYLFAPKAHLPGTKMAFAGVKVTKERADLVAYLRSLADTPEALPQ